MIQPILELDPLKVYSPNRKLKAVWSMEAQQDLKAMHNIDAEGALASIMAKEIQDEIDQEIIRDLAATAAINEAKARKKKKYRSIDDPWDC